MKRSIITASICIVFGLGLLNLAGCGTLKDKELELPEVLVKEAMHDFRHGNYYDALETFNKIKDHYPFSSHSLLAELKIADCNYYLKKYEEALPQYMEFEQNHPTNEAIPYVLFQIGMSHFKMIDSIDRDTTGAKEAIQNFSRLLKSFPQSPYTEEAQVKIAKAKDFLARHELYVAEFYGRTKQYRQAEGRLEYIIDNYPQSSVAEKAKRMLVDVRKQVAGQEKKSQKAE